jgi:hypothetical protein
MAARHEVEVRDATWWDVAVWVVYSDLQPAFGVVDNRVEELRLGDLEF